MSFAFTIATLTFGVAAWMCCGVTAIGCFLFGWAALVCAIIARLLWLDETKPTNDDF